MAVKVKKEKEKVKVQASEPPNDQPTKESNPPEEEPEKNSLLLVFGQILGDGIP